MQTTEKILLNQYGMLVTDRQLVIGGVSRPMGQISAVHVESSSAYRGKSIPFFIALMFVLWAVVELVNGPPDYYWAGFAGLLAILSFGVVRLVGGFQVHTVFLTTPGGELAAYQSRDGKAVSALVTALRLALAEHQTQRAATAWLPHQHPVHG